MAKMILEGVRVVDWTIAHAGPRGTAWLAALGAEVIKVEQAGKGDQAGVGATSFMGVKSTFGDERRPIYEIANLNKKSLTLDLSKPQGREVMYQMVERSDVFATNQLPDTVEKWGMDYETLKKHNPQIIYVTNSIMGYNGPYRLTPGWDTLGQAASGTLTTSGRRGESPTLASHGIGDCTSGFAMFAGVLAALLHKKNTGEGQRVDTSQFQALMNIPVSALLAVCSVMTEEERKADPYGGICRFDSREHEMNNYYQCKDGKYLFVTLGHDKYFFNLVKAMGHPELAQDPKFIGRQNREANGPELIRTLDEAFSRYTVKEWMEKFKGQDIPVYPVNDLPDLLEDPQVLANDMLWTFEYPEVGEVKLPGMPFNLSKTPARMVRPAPRYGEHTEEVLLEMGYSWDDILRLREQRVI